MFLLSSSNSRICYLFGHIGFRRHQIPQFSPSVVEKTSRVRAQNHIEMLAAVAFMQASETGDYDGFLKLLNRARAKQIEMPLFDPPPPLKSEAIESKS